MKMSSFIIGGLAVDTNADKIYFIDSKSDSIKKLNIITGQVGTLTYVSSASGTRLHAVWIYIMLDSIYFEKLYDLFEFLV